MQFFDTHIHLADFGTNKPEDIMAYLDEFGVKKCVCVSAHIKDWPLVADFARNFAFRVVPAFGLHPWYVKEAGDTFQNDLETYLEEFPSALIGECGFDKLKNQDIDAQKKVFDVELDLALRYHRPLLLHTVKSDGVMQEYDAFLPQNSVFHSFSGSLERAKQIKKFGFYIAVNRKFFNKKDAEDILKTIDKNKLLIETDAPYQSKAEDLPEVVKKIAQILNQDEKQTADMLYLNALEALVND